MYVCCMCVFLNYQKRLNRLSRIFLEAFPCSGTGYSEKKNLHPEYVFLENQFFPKMTREFNSKYTNIEIPYL